MLHSGHPPSVILSVRENSDSTVEGEGQQGAPRAAGVEHTRCVTSHSTDQLQQITMRSTINLPRKLRLAVTWTALLLSAIATANSQPAAIEILTNDQIIQMVTGGVPKELILIKVRQTRSSYDLSSIGLVRLTVSKVHREIISAMISARQDAKASGLSWADAIVTDEVLTNEAIVRMVTGGVARSVIDQTLRNSRSAFDMSAPGLCRLKENNVPSDLIKAMIVPPTAPSNVALTIRDAPSATTSIEGTASTTASSVGTANPPPLPAPVRKPKSQLASLPTESGIHMRATGMALTLLEPNSYSAGKTSGAFSSAITGGLAKARLKAVITSREASIQTSDANVEFYFVFERSKANLGTAGQDWSASLTSPNQFVLLRLEQKDKSREVTTGSVNAFGSQSGTDDKASVPFTLSRLRPGVYRVIPREPLAPGQYGFFPASGGGQGTAGSARLFDFGVIVP